MYTNLLFKMDLENHKYSFIIGVGLTGNVFGL